MNPKLWSSVFFVATWNSLPDSLRGFQRFQASAENTSILTSRKYWQDLLSRL